MTTFTGVLAVLHTPTPDGRQLDEPHPDLTRLLPLPLVRPGEHGIGRIDRVWRDGDLLRYSGELDDKHPDAEKTLAEIRDGRLVGMLDADGVGNTEYLYQGRQVSDSEEIPLDAGSGDVTVIMRGWRVTAATLMPSAGKAWPEVSLTLDA